MNSHKQNEPNDLLTRIENRVKMKRFRILIDDDLESAIVAHDNMSTANGALSSLSNIGSQIRNDSGNIEYNKHDIALFIRNLSEFYEGNITSTEVEYLYSLLEQREILLSTDGDITCPQELKVH